MNVCWSPKKLLLNSFLGLFFILITNTVHAQNVQVYKDGPIHEAFVTPSTANDVIIQGVAQAPPPDINEQIPTQCHSAAIWIPGYWAWVANYNDYVWVSGVWRRPPPEHIWIPGYWKQFGNSWGWIRGFWSKVSEKDLQYINDVPPDPKNEAIPAAPDNNSFWLPGYWDYNYASRQYNWLKGQWVALSPDWVYVPAYYLWRPGGYIFIPGYWDYPLEVRGCAYSAVTIAPQYRSTIVYTPTVILETEIILGWLIGYYPNYMIFFWHHWHFHPGFWGGWCCTPPWWWWDTCWCFNWFDSWWLWWWWLHDGFPAPPWLLAAMAQNIPPPLPLMVEKAKNVHPGPILAPWGMIPPAEIIDKIPGDEPVMPADPEDAEDIIDSLKPDETPDNTFRPSGTEEDLKNPQPRPDLDEGEDEGDGVATPPPPPSQPRPPMTQPPTNVPRPTTPPAPPWNPPGYRPLPRPPTNVIPPQAVPRPRPERPWRPPHYVPQPHRPPGTNHVAPDGHGPHYPRPSKPPSYKPPSSYLPKPPSYTPPSHTTPPSHGGYGPTETPPPRGEINGSSRGWGKPSGGGSEMIRPQVQRPYMPSQTMRQFPQQQRQVNPQMLRPSQGMRFQPQQHQQQQPDRSQQNQTAPNRNMMY